jgi:hypothetical protein
MAKQSKLGDFINNMPKENKVPLQKIVPLKEKEITKKFLMNMPIDTYEFLREKAFRENSDIKTLILSALNKTYKLS